MERSLLEKRLCLLYALQSTDIQLDELEELKGNLPEKVNELTLNQNKLEEKIEELNNSIKNNIIKSNDADVELISLSENIEKYKKQQFEVKSNKQYDALTREIENAESRVEQLVKEIDFLEGQIKNQKEEVETLQKELNTVVDELNDRKKELEIILKANEKEELLYQQKREKLIAQISHQDLQQYQRIRTAKNGRAIVAVKRNSCGGCYNSVTAQTLVELRQNEKLFTCEHCGRILVSDYIVEISKNIL